MIFLTWISKHRKKDLHAAHSSFLFMGVYHTTMEGSFMDLIIRLLLVHGKNCVFSLIDYLTQYLHSLTIFIQCIAPQEGKPLFGLHGHFWTSIYDGDSHFLYGFGQVLYYFLYTQLIYNSIYYSLVNVMKCATSNLLGDNLPHHVLKMQLVKLRCD